MKDYFGDLIIRIKNGNKVKAKTIAMHPYMPKHCYAFLNLLRDEGYILGYQQTIDKTTNKPIVNVLLKYNNMGVPAIRNIYQISKPGRRIYWSTKALWKPKSTGGLLVLMTPKGFLTDRDARLLNIGGEVFCGLY